MRPDFVSASYEGVAPEKVVRHCRGGKKDAHPDRSQQRDNRFPSHRRVPPVAVPFLLTSAHDRPLTPLSDTVVNVIFFTSAGFWGGLVQRSRPRINDTRPYNKYGMWWQCDGGGAEPRSVWPDSCPGGRRKRKAHCQTIAKRLPNDCQNDWQSPVFRGAHWLSLVRLGGGLSELKTENAGLCSPQAFYAPDALAALTFVTLC